MKTLTHVWVWMVLAILIGCEDLGVISRELEEDDIKESVFRYQFYNNGSGYFHDGNVDERIRFFALARAELHPVYGYPTQYFDLDDSYMRRFADAQRPLRKHSQLRMDNYGLVYDRVTGEQGILFWVGSIRWVTSEHVEAEGGYFLGGLNAERDVFFVTRRNNQWSVDSLRVRGVS